LTQGVGRAPADGRRVEAAALASRPDALPLADLGPELADLADTATIEALDLVITVDTSVANLAGALGRPVWVLLLIAADWRWGTGDSTPWYPSARLFRQPRWGDWASVVERVADELGRLAATQGAA
jgi:hypothetical protein